MFFIKKKKEISEIPNSLNCEHRSSFSFLEKIVDLYKVAFGMIISMLGFLLIILILLIIIVYIL